MNLLDLTELLGYPTGLEKIKFNVSHLVIISIREKNGKI